MVESDRERFAVDVMAPLAEVFGEISALTIQAWWMALQAYPFVAIQQAALCCLRSVRSRTDAEGHQWRALWPTPGDVIAVMGHQAEASEEQRVPRKALPAPAVRSAMAHEAMARINAALAGQLTVDALITWCAEAEARWPGIGWAAAGEQLRLRPQPTRVGKHGLTRARAILQAWEQAPWASRQRPREEIERQKEILRGLDGQPVAEEPPF